MKVSVIVPVYKINEKYLRACIESLIKQTLEDIEIILVDDGSPDNSGEICDGYKVTCNKINVIHQNNKGVSAARNIGINQSHGEYIMFVDADDVLAEDACELAYQYAIQSKTDILIFKYRSDLDAPKQNNSFKITKDTNMRELQLKTLDRNRISNYDEYPVGSPWGKIFSSTFIKTNDLFYKVGLKKAQDRLFMLNCYEKCLEVTFLDYEGYVYTHNNDSICQKYNSSINQTARDMVDAFHEFVVTFHYDDEEYLDAYQNFTVSVMLETIYLDYFHPNNKQKFRRRYTEFHNNYNSYEYRNSIKNINLKQFAFKERFALTLLRHKMVFLSSIAFELHRRKIMNR